MRRFVYLYRSAPSSIDSIDKRVLPSLSQKGQTNPGKMTPTSWRTTMSALFGGLAGSPASRRSLSRLEGVTNGSIRD